MSGESLDSLKRVDRWDFTAEETSAAWQSSNLGDGLHLELPLDEKSLPDGPLELWARLVGPDGAKLLTRVPFTAGDLQSLNATGAATAGTRADDLELASNAQPISAAVSDGPPVANQEPPTAWRAASELPRLGRGESAASSVGGQPAAWTSQALGRPPAAGARREANGGAAAPPRWKQSSTVNPLRGTPENADAWEPFR
jgi:hypothetical protein